MIFLGLFSTVFSLHINYAISIEPVLTLTRLPYSSYRKIVRRSESVVETSVVRAQRSTVLAQPEDDCYFALKLWGAVSH